MTFESYSPLVSIIIPCWNAEDCVGEAIESAHRIVTISIRWALFGQPHCTAGMILPLGVGVTLLLVGGAFYFRRMERWFADLA